VLEELRVVCRIVLVVLPASLEGLLLFREDLDEPADSQLFRDLDRSDHLCHMIDFVPVRSVQG